MKDYFGAGLISAIAISLIALPFVQIITGYPETKHDTRDLKITFLFAVSGFVLGILLEYRRRRQEK